MGVGPAEDVPAPQLDTPTPEAIEATTAADKSEVGLSFKCLAPRLVPPTNHCQYWRATEMYFTFEYCGTLPELQKV